MYFNIYLQAPTLRYWPRIRYFRRICSHWSSGATVRSFSTWSASCICSSRWPLCAMNFLCLLWTWSLRSWALRMMWRAPRSWPPAAVHRNCSPALSVCSCRSTTLESVRSWVRLCLIFCLLSVCVRCSLKLCYR